MADVTIYKPATVTVQVIDGDPPVDQSQQVADLTAQLAAANATITTLQGKIAAAVAAAQAAKDADAAVVDGQSVLDALA